MTIIGMNYTTSSEGKKNYTLQVADEYDSYYSNAEAGRGCIGQKTDAIYVGAYDCSQIKVGMQIEVMYDKAVNTRNGIYQPIKKIVVVR